MSSTLFPRRIRRNVRGAIRSSALLLGAGLLLLGLLVLLRSDRSEAKGRSSRGETQEPRSDHANPLDPAAEGRAGSRSVLAGSDSTLEESTSASSVSEREVGDGEIRGRVLDMVGNTIAGARVSLRSRALAAFSFPSAEEEASTRTLAETSTDAEGGFRFELERGWVVDLVGSADGFVEETSLNRQAGDFVELRLSEGSLVHGRITRAEDEEPVEGALVRVFRFRAWPEREFETRSGADGVYSVRVRGREPAMLEVIGLCEQSTDWIPIAFGEDGTCEVNVALETGMRVEGRVTDALSGVAIEGATVEKGWEGLRRTTTDASGTYGLDGFGNMNRSVLIATAKGYGRAQHMVSSAAENGVVRADFALEPGHVARGRILDPRGRPIEGAYVAAIAVAIRGEWQETDWPAAVSKDDGSFRIEDMMADLHHVLLVGKPGWATHAFEFPASEAQEPETDLGDLVLTPPARIEGRVLDSKGVGLPGVEVSLHGSNADRFSLGEEQEQDLADDYVAERTTRTDGTGGFRFEDVAEGSYRLRARQPGWASQPQLALLVQEGIDRTDLVLSMEAGPSIAGRVVDEEGAPVLAVNVSLQRRADEGGRPPEGRSAGSLWTPADGSFAFRGLLPGEYSLMASPQPYMESDSAGAWIRTTLPSVRAGSEDLVVVVRRGAEIHGVLLDADGNPAAGHVVQAGGDVPAPASLIFTDSEGRFTVPVPRNTVCDLVVYSRMGGMGPLKILLTQPDVVAGSSGLVLQLPEASE